MSIETEIKGSPSSIRSAGEWVGTTLRPAVESGLEAFGDARTEAGGDWRGETGAAFEDAMGRAIAGTRPLKKSTEDVRTTFLDYAGSLESCQGRMEQIRADAKSAGLTVSDHVIESPGAGPARPGDPPVDASQGQVDAYNGDVAAYNAHQDKVLAYNALVTSANEVWADMERAWERVAAQNRALDGPGWAFQLSDVAGGLGGALAQLHTSALRGNAQYFADLSADYLQRLHSTGNVPNAARFYDDLAHWNRVAGESVDDLSKAARLANVGRFAPIALGGVLAVGGGFYDYHVKGESAEQAILSNAGGFAASVATGAVVGTMIGGPVGTVAGVIVGAGVGVFTSGMIDGLWDNNGDVSDALMAGVDSVVDTGEALADVGGAIVDGIGSLFD